MTDTPKNPEGGHQQPFKPVRRSEYWGSVIVLAFVAAFFISIAALCYGIIATPRATSGEIPTIAFPWIGWFAALLVSTAGIIGFAQYIAGKNTDEPGPDETKERAWAEQLPRRALKAYRIIKDAPLFMVCSALIALGATLLVIDGALAFVSGIFRALVPYAPFFIGGLTVFVVAIAVLMAWFRHANNKLAAEYAFRREVLERTGVILLDGKGKAILPPGGGRDRYAMGSVKAITVDGGPVIEAEPVKALPEDSRGQ